MFLTLPLLAAFATAALAQDVQTFLNDNPSTAAFWRVLRDYPDVLADLYNAGDITLLVPSETALSESSIEEQNETQLQQLLRYHVLQGSYSVEELLEADPFVPTLMTDAGVSGGQRVQISGSDDAVNVFSGLNRQASIDAEHRDLVIDAGHVHIIDTVLTLPVSILNTAIAAGLTSFAGAVNSSSVDVEGEDDCTFFVPTNEAFAVVGNALQNASSEDVDDLVLYHFINDTTPIYTPRIDHEQWISALRENVTMSYLDGDELFINSARVTQANILVENGVLHILDQVLNPADAGGDPPPEAESSSAYPEAAETETISFADGIANSTDAEETLGEGPQATPLGTLGEESEGGGGTEDSEASEGSDETKNSAQRLTTSSLAAAVYVALAMVLI